MRQKYLWGPDRKVLLIMGMVGRVESLISIISRPVNRSFYLLGLDKEVDVEKRILFFKLLTLLC